MKMTDQIAPHKNDVHCIHNLSDLNSRLLHFYGLIYRLASWFFACLQTSFLFTCIAFALLLSVPVSVLSLKKTNAVNTRTLTLDGSGKLMLHETRRKVHSVEIQIHADVRGGEFFCNTRRKRCVSLSLAPACDNRL